MTIMRSLRSVSAINLALYWLPVIGWMAIIFILSNTTSSSVRDIKDGLPLDILRAISSPEIVHTVEYAVLASLTYRLMFFHDVRNIPYLVGLSLLGAVLYGISDEFHQGFVAGRDSSPYDVGLDFLGACLGTGVTAAAFYFFPTSWLYRLATHKGPKLTSEL